MRMGYARSRKYDENVHVSSFHLIVLLLGAVEFPVPWESWVRADIGFAIGYVVEGGVLRAKLRGKRVYQIPAACSVSYSLTS